MRVLLRDGSTVFRQVTIAVALPAPTVAPPTAPPPPASDPLAGTRWDLVNVNSGQAIITLLPGTSATFDFGSGAQVNGNSGCNTFSGPYRSSDNNITIGPLSGTMMVCSEPAGLMAQEGYVMAALQSSSTFRINGNKLEMSNAAGQITVVANRAP